MSRVGALAVRRSIEYTFDPNTGRSQREVWQGDIATLRGLAVTYEAAKIRCTVSEDAGIATLTTDYSPVQDNQPEVPADRYEFATEYVQESIWNSPWVYAYAKADKSAGETTDDHIATWKSVVQASLKDNDEGGPVKPSESGFAGILLDIYKAVVLNGETYEKARISLMRTRTVSQRSAIRLTPIQLPTVYTTAGLISTFSIPSEVQAFMPTVPATDSYAGTDRVWAWMMRRQTSSITRFTNKVEEVMDWVFDAWPNVFYDVIDA